MKYFFVNVRFFIFITLIFYFISSAQNQNLINQVNLPFIIKSYQTAIKNTDGSQSLLFKNYHNLVTTKMYYILSSGNQDIPKSNNKNIPRDLLNAGNILFSDFVQFYSSPLRWKWKDIILLGGITFSTGLIYIYDQEILDAVQRNRSTFILKQLLNIGDFFEPVGHMGVMNKYYFAGLGIGYIFNLRPLTMVSGQILESYFIAGTFKNISSILVGRKRPFEGQGPYSFSFKGGTSFPSGHALNIFQLATILSYHIRFLPFQVIAYGIALGISLQRIESENHWPSDVYFATIFGSLVAKTVLKLHEKRRISITPTVMPKSKIFNLQMSFHW